MHFLCYFLLHFLCTFFITPTVSLRSEWYRRNTLQRGGFGENRSGFGWCEMEALFGGVLLEDEIRHRVAAFRAKLDRCELSDRSIWRFIIDGNKRRHGSIRNVRTEAYFFANPIGTFAGDGLLGQLIAKPHFKRRTVQTMKFRRFYRTSKSAWLRDPLA